MDKVTASRIVIALWASYAGLPNSERLPFWGQYEEDDAGEGDAAPPDMRESVMGHLVFKHGAYSEQLERLMTDIQVHRDRDGRRMLNMPGPFLARWRDELR